MHETSSMMMILPSNSSLLSTTHLLWSTNIAFWSNLKVELGSRMLSGLVERQHLTPSSLTSSDHLYMISSLRKIANSPFILSWILETNWYVGLWWVLALADANLFPSSCLWSISIHTTTFMAISNHKIPLLVEVICSKLFLLLILVSSRSTGILPPKPTCHFAMVDILPALLHLRQSITTWGLCLVVVTIWSHSYTCWFISYTVPFHGSVLNMRTSPALPYWHAR